MGGKILTRFEKLTRIWCLIGRMLIKFPTAVNNNIRTRMLGQLRFRPSSAIHTPLAYEWARNVTASGKDEPREDQIALLTWPFGDPSALVLISGEPKRAPVACRPSKWLSPIVSTYFAPPKVPLCELKIFPSS